MATTIWTLQSRHLFHSLPLLDRGITVTTLIQPTIHTDVTEDAAAIRRVNESNHEPNPSLCANRGDVIA